MNFIASSPDLSLSGANQLLASLLQGFIESGHHAKWIVTSHEGNQEAKWLDAAKLEFKSLEKTALKDVSGRQRQFIDIIKNASPCIYFPNFDFDMMWAIPAFPNDCKTVFIFHSDDPVYYQAVKDHGENLDAIVCVSAYLADHLKQLWPKLAARIHHIPFGVAPQNESFERSCSTDDPLEVVYCGRLAHQQKLIGDLATIILECHHKKLRIRFHIAGKGPDEIEFFEKIAEPLAAKKVIRHGLISNENVQSLLRKSHVFILTSAYEGLPVSLLEAMAAGCLPIVTHVASGIPEVITHGKDGFIHPIGDTEAMVNQLAHLTKNRQQVISTGKSARARIIEGGYTKAASVNGYLLLADKLSNQKNHFRASTRSALPPNYRLSNRLRSFILKLARFNAK